MRHVEQPERPSRSIKTPGPGYRRRKAVQPNRRRKVSLQRLEQRDLLTVFGPAPEVASELSAFVAPASSSPGAFTAVGEQMFFTAFEPEHGTELWRSDGTEFGTRLVKDLLAGPDGSSPRNLTAFQDVLYFSSHNTLWKSDGTASGTVLVGEFGAAPQWIAATGGILFLLVNDAQGAQLWRSDGSAGGTAQLHQFAFVTGASLFAEVDGAFFFIVDSGSHDQLWKSNGQTGGTTLVYEFPQTFLFDIGLVNVREMVGWNGSLYLAMGAAGATEAGRELWTSDGTTATLLDTFNASPTDLTVVGDELFFIVDYSSDTGASVYKTDGSIGGAQPVFSGPIDDHLFDIDNLWEAGGSLYVATSAHDRSLGEDFNELWTLDAGHQRIILHETSGFESVGLLVEMNGLVYFSTDGRTPQLWVTDATPAGTHLVRDLVEANGFSPGAIGVVQDRLFFAIGDNTHGREPWSSDGTEAGTSLLKDINTNTVPVEIAQSIEWNGFTYLISGGNLWRTDGTAHNTVLLAQDATTLSVSGQHLFHTAIDVGAAGNEYQHWKSDGTLGGAERLLPNGVPVRPFDFTEFAGTVYFLGFDLETEYLQLWRIDDATGGASLLRDFQVAAPNIFNRHAAFSADLNASPGTLYIDASRSLWTIAENSAELQPLREGTESFRGIVPLGDEWLFSLVDTQSGQALIAKTDGTPTGATVLQTFPALRDFFNFTTNGVHNLTSAGDAVFFLNQQQLWITDGTTAGTAMLKDFGHTFVEQLVVLRDDLYFVVVEFEPVGLDFVERRQLWKSDGTAAGTAAVTGHFPLGFKPSHLTVIDGELLFSADDGLHGEEPWSSDGTAAGTVLVADLNPGARGSHPTQFLEIGGRVVITTADGPAGPARWAVSTLSVRNSQYVTAVYQDVLRRPADPQGLAWWTDRAAVRAEIGSVAAAISHSDEYYANFVIGPGYQKYLNREADAEGLAYWTFLMRDGLTDEQLESHLIASDEFYGAAGGFDDQWVDALYQAVLGRSADAQGAAHWTGRLAAGIGRREIALGFTKSLERETGRIVDLYLHYIGREPDPDGLNFWLGQFAAGRTHEDLITGFTSSDEYYRRHTQ